MEVGPFLVLLIHAPSASSISSLRFWKTSFLLSSSFLGQEGQKHSKPFQGLAPSFLCLLHGFQFSSKTMGRQMDDGFVKGFS